MYAACALPRQSLKCPREQTRLRLLRGLQPLRAVLLCWPSRPRQPVAHCPRTLHWQAMQPCRIVIRPALPQKSKLFRHPDSLLAWHLGGASSGWQSLPAYAIDPPCHRCTPACNYAIREAGKTLGRSQSIEDPQKYEWLAQLQNRNTNHHGCTATTAASDYDTDAVIDHALSHCPPVLFAHCSINRTRRAQ